MSGTVFNHDKRFDLDLSFGNVYESAVAEMLQHSKIEVKSERDIWVKSGNIVIEFESRGKPSGIQTTEAEFWFHNLVKDGKILTSIVLPVKILKRYIATNKVRVVRGGDAMTSKLFLINLPDFFSNIGKLNYD